jgi:hypothetical protein
VFRNATGHDAEIFSLLNFACRNGVVSELKDGNMRIDLREPLRTRLLDTLARLGQRYPGCLQRVEASTLIPAYGQTVVKAKRIHTARWQQTLSRVRFLQTMDSSNQVLFPMLIAKSRAPSRLLTR